MTAATVPVRLAAAALAIGLAGALVAGPVAAEPPAALPGAEVTVVRVEAGADDDRRRLLGLGLDVVDADEHGAELFLYDDAEAAALRDAGFEPVVVDHDRSPAALALGPACARRC